MERNCKTCGEPFVAERKTRVYCSADCRYHDFITKKKRITIPRDLRFSILHRDKFRCRYCGAGPSLDKDGNPKLSTLKVDHVLSIADGGYLTDTENLVTACNDCNAGKSKLSLDISEVPPVPED